jgi:hypothetical protein
MQFNGTREQDGLLLLCCSTTSVVSFDERPQTQTRRLGGYIALGLALLFSELTSSGSREMAALESHDLEEARLRSDRYEGGIA